MPRFFGFITCMAYYVFYHEQVDVVIMEVGAGGSYCPRNIVRKPVVVGITSIALEHVEMLGNTLEQIAGHKAGIIKENAVVYTVRNQVPEVMGILRQRALEVKAPFHVVPDLENYSKETPFKLRINDGLVSRINASLALQLANTFLLEKYPEKLTTGLDGHGAVFPLVEHYIKGLENCTWRGRFQKLRKTPNLTYHLDGAHTVESLEAALNWFLNVTDDSSYRILVFFVTGERSAENLIRPFLRESDRIQMALFSPLAVSSSCHSMSPDSWCQLEVNDEDMAKCQNLSKIWTSLTNSKAVVMKFMDQVLNHINGTSEKNINVLITGSLRMVGTYLSILNPDCADDV